MGISKYNSEGYHDPTTYEALSKIEKEEKRRNGLTGRWSIYAPRLPGMWRTT